MADADWLRARYVDDGMPIAEIARRASSDVSTVHLWLQRHGIERRNAHVINRRRVERMLAKGKTVGEIARTLDVDRSVIRHRLHRWGIVRPPGVSDEDAQQLAQWYIGGGWSIERIAAKLGVSKRTATRRLIAAGIPLRKAGRLRA